MGVYLGGVEYGKVYAGGLEFSGLQVRGQSYKSSDTPGTLNLSVTRSGGRTTWTFSITDPNGIRAVTAATMTARDGTVANILADFTRSDANTFGGTDTRANARWRRGNMSVTYVDATSGASHTLTQAWDV